MNKEIINKIYCDGFRTKEHIPTKAQGDRREVFK